MQPIVSLGRVRANVGERQNLAGKRVEHDRRAAPRAAGADFVRELILGERLNLGIDRQLDTRSRLRTAKGERAVEDRIAERVTIKAQLERLAADQMLVLRFNPGESLAIHPRQPNHSRCQVTLRVKTFVLAQRVETVESQRLRRLGTLGRQMARQPHEGRRMLEP